MKWLVSYGRCVIQSSMYITFLTVTTMLSIPVDVLQEILVHVHKADLPTLCRVNKIFCSYSRDVLYREIGYKNDVKTLAQSTDLARRVRSFKTEHSPELGTALRNMSSLRSLFLDFIGDKSSDESVLDGCTFKLESFACDFYGCNFSHGKWLQQFLNNQPGLTNLTLLADDDYDDEFADSEPLFQFDETCLPNLTRVMAIPSFLCKLIPGRPVREVIIRLPWNIDSIDYSFFTLSTTPIQKLRIYYDTLYPKPVSLLVSVFPSLVHLVVYPQDYDVKWTVRAPLCLSI
jgi:hypothetical protein